MSSLRLHPRAPSNQNLILDKLNQEAVTLHSVEAHYVPRTLVAEDTVLGEDRLSKFENAYRIDLYVESVDGFEGQNSFASKFGLQIESGATFVLARRSWDLLVGREGTTVLPNRPAEGDLIYLPLTKGLFEINFVNHQMPFYQLGQYYTYKLQVELFRYAGERVETGVSAIDKFETVHTTDITKRPDIDTLVRGADNNKFKQRANALVLDVNNPFGDI